MRDSLGEVGGIIIKEKKNDHDRRMRCRLACRLRYMKKGGGEKREERERSAD